MSEYAVGIILSIPSNCSCSLKKRVFSIHIKLRRKLYEHFSYAPISLRNGTMDCTGKVIRQRACHQWMEHLSNEMLDGIPFCNKCFDVCYGSESLKWRKILEIYRDISSLKCYCQKCVVSYGFAI